MPRTSCTLQYVKIVQYFGKIILFQEQTLFPLSLLLLPHISYLATIVERERPWDNFAGTKCKTNVLYVQLHDFREIKIVEAARTEVGYLTSEYSCRERSAM